MGIGLKLFWGTILSLFIIGLIVLKTVGVPSPAVDVRKKIDVEKLLQ